MKHSLTRNSLNDDDDSQARHRISGGYSWPVSKVAAISARRGEWRLFPALRAEPRDPLVWPRCGQPSCVTYPRAHRCAAVATPPRAVVPYPIARVLCSSFRFSSFPGVDRAAWAPRPALRGRAPGMTSAATATVQESERVPQSFSVANDVQRQPQAQDQVGAEELTMRPISGRAYLMSQVRLFASSAGTGLRAAWRKLPWSTCQAR
jgi:hypothetical protein